MDDVTVDARVQLEVWSDIACPWCYVGRRNLSIALEDLPEHERPAVTWRAFQLDPMVPAEGVDADEYFMSRYGPDLGAFEQSRERLVAMGEEVGIDFRFDRQRIVPNTYLVHRVLAAADLHEEREALMDACFSAYFERGIDIGSPENLREVAGVHLGDMNLGARLVELAISDPTRTQRVDEDLATARSLGITGVPCFVADRRIAVPGAVPPPVLAQLIAEATERDEERAAED